MVLATSCLINYTHWIFALYGIERPPSCWRMDERPSHLNVKILRIFLSGAMEFTQRNTVYFCVMSVYSYYYLWFRCTSLTRCRSRFFNFSQHKKKVNTRSKNANNNNNPILSLSSTLFCIRRLFAVNIYCTHILNKYKNNTSKIHAQPNNMRRPESNNKYD